MLSHELGLFSFDRLAISSKDLIKLNLSSDAAVWDVKDLQVLGLPEASSYDDWHYAGASPMLAWGLGG